MIRRHVREKPPHDGRKPRAMRCTRPARSARRMTPSQIAMIPIKPSAIVTAVFRAIERALGHLVQPIVPAADRDRENDEREPDVIQHGVY